MEDRWCSVKDGEFAGGKLDIAQHMASHESARTTGLCYRRSDEVALDEVERIAY